ncbi:antigen WC1.1-like [Alligator sinensis]|uniref:Antigen WC1.1-like n=1 Tax=Alligator sinensis TaxID=38654 RepID=A0A3Q0FU38_ALLSI|nr:antigen WC1.1-like [Alligator sinensis]
MTVKRALGCLKAQWKPLNYRLEVEPEDMLHYICETRGELFSADELRLENGGSPCAGTVEIKHQDEWGTVCDDEWDMRDAAVVWFTGFRLVNGSTRLGAYTCSQDSDAGVICSGDSESLRLLNGESRCDGRVEISLSGAWGRVLDDQWDINDAKVVCRQLQCGDAEKAYNPVKSERGTGLVGLRRVQCSGNEPRLTLCNTSLSETEPAGIAEDVGVVCSGSRQIRLVNGTGRCAGRVEIYYQGTWGTVCDDSWDRTDSTVVCKQLGCGHAVEAAASVHYEEGSEQIWLDDVNCSGNESELWECPSRGWGQHDCRHKEDVGVLCSEFMDLRLVNGSDCAGRLEIFYNGSWGSICSNQMTQATVEIVCKQLGCGDEGEIVGDLTYGQGSGHTWLDHVQCLEHHNSLWQCPSESWKPLSCANRGEETHIKCTGSKEKTTPTQFAECPNSTSCTEKEKLRVVEGKDGCSGRVEVWHRGSWGTVCDDSWDMADAAVVCKQLGCGAAESALSEAEFGKGTGPIWLDKLNCKGTESSLWDCCAEPWGNNECHHKEDAAVICTNKSEATASPDRTEPPQRPSLTGGRDMVPIVICIVLGALLCLVLIMLGGQVQSTRALRRASGRYSGPLTDAVYEEIDYNLMREKLEMFGHSVSYSEDSVMKLQYYTGDSEDGNDPGSAQEETSRGDLQQDYDSVEEPEWSDIPVPPDGKEALPLAGDVTEDGYDEAAEVPGLPHFPVSGLTGVPAEREENLQTYGDSQTEWSMPWLKSEGTFESLEDDPALLPGDTGYDDVEDGISVSSP